MVLSHIEIKPCDENASVFTELFLDGHKVNGVRELTYHCEPNKIPTLTIDLNAMDIAIDQTVFMYSKNMGHIKHIVFDDDIEN